MANEGLVPTVAGAILDSEEIDWALLESNADLAERPLLEELRLVAAVAAFHRRLPDLESEERPAARDDRQDPIPEMWGHLRILERIGRGAFGEVFRAWDTRLDREVALKLLPAESGDGHARATTIIDEGRLLARVRHPNVATIYGAERIGNQVGLWMELVDGRTLEEMARTGSAFTPAQAIRIGVELCRAMSAVHQAGLLHRDIKAQNVMVARDDRVVLMDFGTGCDPNERSPATLAGTPLYLAPELLDGRDATVQSDIYSAGVLLHRMLSGTYPLEAQSLSQLRELHRRQQYRPLRSVRPDLSSALGAVIDRAVDPRPDRRYPSADALADALKAAEARARLTRYGYPAAVAAALVFIAWIAWSARGPRESSQPAPRSVAVLPFKPLVAKGADDQLTLGMTEAVINRLSRIQALRVEPLARVRRYEALDQDPLEAGRALGAEVVLEAHFQMIDSAIHVRWRLLETAGGTALAANEWQEPFNSILTVQRQLAESIANALQVTLTPTERAGIQQPDTISAEAFRHYMFGRYHLEVREGNRMRQAEREFREALKLDPQYARAHGALALTLAHLAWLAGEKANEVMPQAKEAALTALAIDETVALAHTALAHVYEIFDYDPVRAQAEHLRAMQLDDQDLWVLRTYATFLMSRGAIDEGLALNRRALDLDPTAPLSMRWQAMLLYVARRYDDCVAECRKALMLDPNDGGLVYNWLPRCLEAQGKKAETVDAYEHARTLRRSSETAERLKAVYAAQGWEASWRARLVLLPGPGQAAFAHLRLGNTDEVIRILQQLYDARAPWVVFTNQPEWDPVRSDPRFQAIRRNAGLGDDLNPTLAAARRAANAGSRK